MIDAIVAGLIGGTLGPSLGGGFCRLSYSRTVVAGFFFGGVVTLSIFIYGSIVNGFDFGAIPRSYYRDISNGDWLGVFLATFTFPISFALFFAFLKLCNLGLTWEQAQLEFEHERYRRTVSEDGGLVIFERGRNKFIARCNAGETPRQIEWYTDGKRQGTVFLRKG